MQQQIPTPPQRKSRNLLPAILVAGLLLAGGTWVWSRNAAPLQAVAPGVVTVQDAPEPDWKDAPAAEKEAAQKVIVAQLEAFKADNWELAETYQSAGLKGNFASPEEFERVIKGTYPEFANYKSVSWGKARIAGPLLQIQVSLTGANGKQIAALYSMIKEPVDPKDKSKTDYRVSGVSGGEAVPNDARIV